MTKDYVIEPTNGSPALKFTGELVASASSERNNSFKWTELEAYKTNGGKWVIVVIGAVNEGAEPHLKRLVEAHVFDANQTDRLTSKIGYGRLARKLYERMGINTVTID